ncbi:MAG: type II toxin-antitoxin system death-on-curing family toxin [Pseudonocardiaceae bacterium]
MTVYLTLDDLLRVATAAIDGEVQVRDYGLLESALARPVATVFGHDAYPDLHVKAAALLHSLCTNHALIDGNKPMAFAAAAVFLEINRQVSVVDDDAQYELVMAVAAGKLDELEEIAGELRRWSPAN